MHVVHVGVGMRPRLVPMRVCVRRLRELLGRVRMLMVFVVFMDMSVLGRLVSVLVFVPIRCQHDRARGHGEECEPTTNRERLAQEQP